MGADRPRSPRHRPVRGPSGDPGAETSSVLPSDPHPGDDGFFLSQPAPRTAQGPPGLPAPVSGPESQLPVHTGIWQVPAGRRSVIGAHLGVPGGRRGGRGKQMLAGAVPAGRASGTETWLSLPGARTSGALCRWRGGLRAGRLQEVRPGVLLALGEPTVCEKKPMASTTPPDNGAERRGRQGAGPGKAPRAGCVGQRQGGRAERAPRGGRSEHARGAGPARAWP